MYKIPSYPVCKTKKINSRQKNLPNFENGDKAGNSSSLRLRWLPLPLGDLPGRPLPRVGFEYASKSSQFLVYLLGPRLFMQRIWKINFNINKTKQKTL